MGKFLSAWRTWVLTVLLAVGGAAAISVTGCEGEEGPVEETTEGIEETGEETGEAVEDTGEEAEDVVD